MTSWDPRRAVDEELARMRMERATPDYEAHLDEAAEDLAANDLPDGVLQIRGIDHRPKTSRTYEVERIGAGFRWWIEHPFEPSFEDWGLESTLAGALTEVSRRLDELAISDPLSG